jgi:hypothetical protein
MQMRITSEQGVSLLLRNAIPDDLKWSGEYISSTLRKQSLRGTKNAQPRERYEILGIERH